MRIIPEEVIPYYRRSNMAPCYLESDTIEITNDEWDDIYQGFDEWETANLYEDFEPTFARYLRELLELKRQ